MADQVLGLINPAIALIFAIGAWLIWKRDPTKRYLLGFVVASLAIGTSFTINHYLVVDSHMVPRLAIGLASMIACNALVWSACARLGREIPLKALIAGGALTLLLIGLSDPARDVTPWLFALNAYCGIVFVIGAQVLASAGSRDVVDRVMVWVFALVAVQFYVRPILAVSIDGAMSSADYRHSVGHAMYVVSGAVFKVMLAGNVIAAAMTDQLRAVKSQTQLDSLSGLSIRSAFEEQAVAMMDRARSGDVPVSLIVADIDHFKRINDRWGHPIGDQVIATFGEVFTRTLRPSDVAGRIGGEEFCILAWNCPEDAATRLAERLRLQFSGEPYEGIHSSERLTASFGVTVVRPGEGYARAYERADVALYRAKRSGRDCVVSDALGRVGEDQAGSSPEGLAPAHGEADQASVVSLTARRLPEREAI
ncbi:MAG: GGDEF domain-containing protein [Pseudomonadota bacterium]